MGSLPPPRQVQLTEFASVRDPTAFDVDWAGFYREAMHLGRALRDQYPHERHVRYGEHPYQLLNVVSPRSDGAGPRAVFVFAHGGAFREGHPDLYDWAARPFVEAGTVFVSVGYRLRPEADVLDAVSDLALALGWIAEHIGEHGGDPTQLFVGGHSAGAMIAAALAVRDDWQADHGVAVDTGRGLLGISGLYDFAALAAGGGREVLGERYEGVDPIRSIVRVPEHVTLVFGTDERNRPGADGPIFARSARNFAQALRDRGGRVHEVELEPATHRDTVRLMGEGDPRVVGTTLEAMNGQIRMIEDVFVINAIAHAYDLRPENIRENRVARAFPEMLYGIHATWNPPEIQVPKELFLTAQTMEVLAATQFRESQVDIAVSHRLALDGWTFSPAVDHEKKRGGDAALA